MYLPSNRNSWAIHVRYGSYVARRLRTAQLNELIDPVKAATLKVQEMGRVWEDTDFTVQEVMADRDAADQVLDEQVREVRRKLIARSNNAEKEAPYTLIIPDGLRWYTSAPVDEELPRYKQLRDRLTSYLPETDELRVDLVPRLSSALDSYAQTEQQLEDTRNAEVRSRDTLEQSLNEWRSLMERTYGALISLYGRSEADRFFPARSHSSASQSNSSSQTSANP